MSKSANQESSKIAGLRHFHIDNKLSKREKPAIFLAFILTCHVTTFMLRAIRLASSDRTSNHNDPLRCYLNARLTRTLKTSYPTPASDTTPGEARIQRAKGRKTRLEHWRRNCSGGWASHMTKHHHKGIYERGGPCLCPLAPTN